MAHQKINCQRAKQIDMVEYLQSLNIHPASIKGSNYWYCSPLHNERTPSFKIDRKLNVWYDHSIGKGGNLIDFGILYFNCSISDFLKQLNQTVTTFSFHQSETLQKERSNTESKIKLIEVRAITDNRLHDYLKERAIPNEIANAYCKEILFEVNRKQQTCIGFKNNAGGYELRNAYYKGTIAPKDFTVIPNGHTSLSVFEGFIDFLSFVTAKEKLLTTPSNYLILNSLAFFDKAKTIMDNHNGIYLFLDNDEAGKKITAKAIDSSSKYIDKSNVYSQYKDVNDWLMKEKNIQQQRTRMRF